jgi:hypothetical protein
METARDTRTGLYPSLAYLAAGPDQTRYTDDSPATSFSTDASSIACAMMTEVLKTKGYLSAEDSSRISCLQWPCNLYWTRSCPKCYKPVHVNFTPIPHAALTEGKSTFTEAENLAFARFLRSCSGGGLIRQILTCESQQCLAKIRVQLVRLEHGGCYMERWGCVEGLGSETERMPFGDSGAVFNQLTTGWLPQNAALKQNAFDFARLLTLPPNELLIYARETSWNDFQEKQLQALREGLWPERAPSLSHVWASDMESLLLGALFDRCTPVDSSEDEVSIRQFVSNGHLFLHWVGNLTWPKKCPSKSCQAKLEVAWTAIPRRIAEADPNRLSKEERASVYEYMLRYHWDSYFPPHWLKNCPVCNVALYVELQRLGFGAYVLDDPGFKVADANEPPSEDRLIKFGDTGAYFNHLRISRRW